MDDDKRGSMDFEGVFLYDDGNELEDRDIEYKKSLENRNEKEWELG